MANLSMPECAVPFPYSLDQATCPDLLRPDAKEVFCMRPTATKLMDQQSGHPTAQPHSMRWLHVSTHGQNSTPLRFPSIASATTYTSSLQLLDETFSIRGEDLPGSEYDMVLSPDGHHGRRMLSQRVPSLSEIQHSAFRHVAPPFSKKRSADLTSLNSVASLPSSPVTPNTPIFVSNPVISYFKEKPLPDIEYTSVVRGNLPKGGSVNGSFREEKSSFAACFRRSSKDPRPEGELAAPFHSNVDLSLQQLQGGSVNGSFREEKSSFAACFRRSSKDPRPEDEAAAPFHPKVDLSLQQLQHARNLDVLDHEGKKVRFGYLWYNQPTCVIFIRHFRCASCMDYMRSIKEQVDPDMLRRAGVRLVLISNGSPAMIRSYNSIFNISFPLYTDPTCALYRALGMTLRTTNGGPESERGSYIRHGTASGIAMVVKNTFMKRIPLHKGVGDVKQLGGEFVLGPGLRCSFVSRMHNTRSHAPVRDVLSAAGVHIDLYSEVTPHTSFYDNEEQWMKDRETELKRIQARKGIRRGFVGEYRDSESIDLDHGPMYVQPLPHLGSSVRALDYINEGPGDSKTD